MKTELLNDIANQVADLVREKNQAYGNSFEESGKILRILFPNGVPPEKFRDMLTIVRIIDKLFRIATDKNAFSEDPWKDIVGYGLLSICSEGETNDSGSSESARRGREVSENQKGAERGERGARR